MPKKILFESFKNRFLIEANNAIYKKINKTNEINDWSEFLSKLSFEYRGKQVLITWKNKKFETENINVDITNLSFYSRVNKDENLYKININKDKTKEKNRLLLEQIIKNVATTAGFVEEKKSNFEEEFHDKWAEIEDPEKIDVKLINEASTSPEMRFITKQIGNFNGKKILDVGCGLGEVSIYFALKGASVTALDISSGMLEKTNQLAKLNGVSIKTHLATAEDFNFSNNEQFDVIYIGNCLHHANIKQTMKNVISHLDKGGIFLSWDPIAYNPMINLYRLIATKVRTPDEHPLKLSDIKLIKNHFKISETNYFWLTTLIIFMLMFIVQFKNPNKERFWKTVIYESKKWEWLYKPLERLDRIILKIFPPLKLLCWNVVIFGKNN